MKKVNTLIIAIALLSAAATRGVNAQTQYTASMGPQYVNEVFFSLRNGEVKTSPRNIWDIAFYTNAFSAGIITNDGSGVALYAYPNAAADGFDSFDTTGMASWQRLYNNTAEWEDGAFNRNALGHPDYGWGIYSMTTHDLTGDSLYLIKPLDGIYRKLHIVKKISTQNKYIIRYAHLDGSNDRTDTLEVNPHYTKMFMAFSFATGIVDREPAKTDWDILFTRYTAQVMNTPYPVNGVLHNSSITMAEAHPVGPAYTDWSILEFKTDPDVIGHDWKTINMSTFQWEITDSLAYFAQSADGSVYKIVMEGFSGSGTGTSTFTVDILATASANLNQIEGVKIYPNPATDKLAISLQGALTQGNAVLYDLSGRAVRTQQLDRSLIHEIGLEGVTSGTYVLRITGKNQTSSFKVIVR